MKTHQFSGLTTCLAVIGTALGLTLLITGHGERALASALLIVSPGLPLLNAVIRGSVSTRRRRRLSPRFTASTKAEYYLSSFRC